jgi:hypothetical protein
MKVDDSALLRFLEKLRRLKAEAEQGENQPKGE